MIAVFFAIVGIGYVHTSLKFSPHSIQHPLHLTLLEQNKHFIVSYVCVGPH